MLTVVTGAAGFVGQALARRMAGTGYGGTVRLVDRVLPEIPAGAFETVASDLGEPGALAEVVADADRIVHLAALPGGAAESDPVGSRRINLELNLDLLEALAAFRRPARLVWASSIAVFGAPLPDPVDDNTSPCPTMTYGAHKLMTEIALGDAARRSRVDAIALRLPGIVARPRGAGGFRSAFASDLFHAVAADEAFTLPVGPDATMWLMSANCAADNLLHALGIALPADTSRVLTLPALHVRIADLVAEIGRATGIAPRIAYDPDPELEAAFGRQPPLRTPAADALGFRHDGNLADLVRAAWPAPSVVDRLELERVQK
jgi:nucleoside-diphosphate-sugar epimerase